MTQSNILNPIEITFAFSKFVSARFVHGAVTLQFDPLQPYTFVSEAVWPSTDNYESAIREAVEEVLLQKVGHLENTKVVLKSIRWDDVASCEVAFRQAAHAATLAAFEI